MDDDNPPITFRLNDERLVRELRKRAKSLDLKSINICAQQIVIDELEHTERFELRLRLAAVESDLAELRAGLARFFDLLDERLPVDENP